MNDRIQALKAKGRVARGVDPDKKPLPAKDGSANGNGSTGHNDPRLKKYAPYGLTGKQHAFVMQYVLDPSNQTEAAIRAGYAERSAHAQAHELLKHPGVQSAVSDLQEVLRSNTEVTVESVVERLSEIAFDRRPKPRSADQVKALELLMKYLGLDTTDALGRVELVISYGDEVQEAMDIDDVEWEDADDD